MWYNVLRYLQPSTWMPAPYLATPTLVQCPTNGLGKVAATGSSVRDPAPM